VADLLARFKLVDEMSDKLGNLAESGQNMVDQWEQAGEAVNAAFEGIAGTTTTTATTIDGVATSISDIAEQTDHWTAAVGNYDRGALEAVYSTEELVEMGLKSVEALEEQERMLEQCERSAGELSKAIDNTADTQKELSNAMEQADKAVKALTNNEDVSAETKADLAKAAEQAAEAMNELERAQEEANEAMEAYDRTLTSGTDNLQELEAAAERASDAADALAQANNRANEATEELARATEQATEEAEDAEKSGTEAAEGIAQALAAAGITAMVKETAEAVYELADSFSEAEKTIVGATGATGEELEALMASATEVFSSSNAESLNDVAAGMTAVQKATGLVGDELEQATSAGIVLEDIFGYEVPQSARTASSLMKNFGLTAKEAYNLITIGAQSGADKNGDLLDVLNEYSAHYAALGLSAEEFMSSLIDGADAGVFSVDKVGDAVKEFNIRAKDGSETSALAFEMLGMDAEEMSAKFAAGGETASEAFFAVVSALDGLDDPMTKNTAAVALFGTMYEDLEASILPVLANIEGGTIEMHDALAVVSEDAKSMGDSWKEAGNSVQTAFSTAISPTITKASTALAGIVKGVGNFLQEHPKVTKAITAIGVGLGVVVVGIAGVAFATSSAIPAIISFGTALNTALGPIGWVSLAITGIVAAGAALVAMMNDTEDATLEMTATTRSQYYQLQDLNEQYDEACKKYGETSEEASSLKYQIDTLSESLEENGKTVEELAAECDALIEKHQQLMQECDETTEALKNEELGNLALITRLEELASSTDQTASTQQEMEAIISGLNSSIDGLNLSYEDLVENQDQALSSLRAMAEAEAKREKTQAMYDEYVKLIRQQAEEEAKLAEVTEEVAAAEEWAAQATDEYLDYLTMVTRYDTTGMAGLSAYFSNEYKEMSAAEEAFDTAATKQEELQTALDETTARIAELEQEWSDIANASTEAADEMVSYEDAVDTVIGNVQQELTELANAYDVAYEAARNSIDSTIGLFDTMSTECETSVSDMLAALQSQTEYLDTYAENLQKAAEYGLDDGLIQSLSDGSTESAGYLQELISNIEALGGTTEGLSTEAQEFVDSFNTAFADVQTSKDEFATAVADMETNFTESVDAIGEKMQEMITDMNMSEDAAAQASATMDSYISSIKAKQAEAVSAAEAVAAATAAALSTSASTGSAVTVPGHANGTTSAESAFIAGEEGRELIVSKAAAYANGTTDSDPYYIAGENGPELIIGQQGSTVFPTEETDRIIDALGERRPLQVFAQAGGSEGREQTTEQVKKILLEIAGSGAIEVGGTGGADKETILEVLYEHLKPVLMSIIQSEIYEEGELSYEF